MKTPKRIVNNFLGPKKRGGKNDWDGDGVSNKKDCQPRNTMRQDTIFKPYKVKIGFNKWEVWDKQDRALHFKGEFNADQALKLATEKEGEK